MTQTEVNDRLLGALQDLQEAQDRMYDAVYGLRTRGATWTQLSIPLGVTPQAVQQRYKP
jgi:hypothetical protein